MHIIINSTKQVYLNFQKSQIRETGKCKMEEGKRLGNNKLVFSFQDIWGFISGLFLFNGREVLGTHKIT